MASELRVNTLKDASGNNSVGISYVSNGSAKAWCNSDGTAITSASDLTGVRDSFNISTVVDTSTGHFTLSWTSTMANENYSVSGMTTNFAGSSTNTNVLGVENLSVPTPSSIDLNTVRTSSTTVTEREHNFISLHGDLA